MKSHLGKHGHKATISSKDAFHGKKHQHPGGQIIEHTAHVKFGHLKHKDQHENHEMGGSY